MKPQPHTAFMAQEIAEQPAILSSRAAAWQEACDDVTLTGCDQIAPLGRGSSGHACVFFSYLHGLSTGRQTVEFHPWLATQPTGDASWENSIALAFSVSGESSDVAHAARWLRERGARVIGITNRAGPASPLGRAAHALVRFDVGEERAVPATKTFTAQLFIAAALAGFRIEAPARETAQAISGMLGGGAPSTVTDFLFGARSVYWIARGPAVSVARDAALKLQEAAGMPSLGYSSAEVLHGPIGALGPEDRVVLLQDAIGGADSMNAVATAVLGRGAPMITIGSPDNTGGRADAIVLGMPGVRWARSAVIAALTQQVALDLALRAGRNPDLPAGLQKVTMTL